MKNSIVLFLLTSLATLSFAQNSCINHFVDKYKGLEESSHLTIGGNLLSFMTNDEDTGDNFRTKLSNLEVLTINDRSQLKAGDISALHQGIEANNYEELIRIRDGKDWIQVFLTEKDPGTINQLIVLVEAPEKFTIVSLSGEIHYEDLSQINIDGEAGNALNHLPATREQHP